MAVVTYINSDYETLAEAMQQLVTMGYFASVEYDSINSAVVCYDADENAVLTITKTTASNPTIALRLDGGTTKSATYANCGAPYYTYLCSGGMYIAFNGGSYGNYAGLFVSKTNNDKVGFMTFMPTGSGVPRYKNVRSWATDDNAEQMDTYFECPPPTLRNQTTLMNIPTCNEAGTASSFPNCFFTFTSQFAYTSNTATPPVNFTQNGKRYLWVGYFAIRDEEAI